MQCPTCNIDMLECHDVKAVHDPQAKDGYGERSVSWMECPKCGHQEATEPEPTEE